MKRWRKRWKNRKRMNEGRVRIGRRRVEGKEMEENEGGEE